jgi:hypothetical protein
MRPRADHGARRVRGVRGLLLALVLVASQASAWSHAVAVAHVACAEHGEAIHGGAMPLDESATAHPDGAGEAAARADVATVAGHDHCANAALLRWRDVALTAPFALVSDDTVSASVPFAPSHVGVAGTVVYLIAPKTSPPARSV